MYKSGIKYILILRILTPGILPPGTGFIIVYIFSPPEFDESEMEHNAMSKLFAQDRTIRTKYHIFEYWTCCYAGAMVVCSFRLVAHLENDSLDTNIASQYV